MTAALLLVVPGVPASVAELARFIRYYWQLPPAGLAILTLSHLAL
jgi:hypothetical protein